MRLSPPTIALLLGALVAGGGVLFAQIEGGDRGVAPLDSSGSLEVNGVAVDVRAGSADAARLGGWRLAQRRGWAMLWQKTHGAGAGVPLLGDDALDSIVAGIIVEDEQIGPNRYVAKLGILFDRARASQLLGVAGQTARSAPMLVLPVEWSGGTPRSFEARTEWQKAWARFRTGNSVVDYVRTSGTGPDPLLLNWGQTLRPGRSWWRLLLDTYGAADVVIPQVRLQRLWPGGPVIGHFSARFGPDNRVLDSFTLRVDNPSGLAAMLDEGVQRIDRIYADALAVGLLQPDPSLIEPPVVDPESLLGNTSEAVAVETEDAGQNAPVGAGVTTITVQFATPDVASVGSTEAAVRGIGGVSGVDTTSLALGGTSVMRVTFAGDATSLRGALEARGFRVEEGGGALRISRGAPAPPPAAAEAPPVP